MIYTRTYLTAGRRHCIRLYNVWRNMHNRCTNPNHKKYPYYGDRGISVCDEWDQFAPFRAWALSSGYGLGLQIDRADNDGDYCPDNCRWVSAEENQKNKTRKVGMTRAPKPRRMRPIGTRNVKARFSAEQVREIRASDKSTYWWVKRLHCGNSTIQKIRSRQTYTDVLIVCFAVMLLGGCAHSDEWTTRDTAVQIGVTVLVAYDAHLTAHLNRTEFFEVGRLPRLVLGRTPEPSDTYIYFASVALFDYLISRALPAEWRPYWQGFNLLDQVYGIGRHCSDGLC